MRCRPNLHVAPVRCFVLLLVVLCVAISTSAADPAPFAEVLVVPPYLDVLVLGIELPSPAAVVTVFPPGARRALTDDGEGVESIAHGPTLSSVVVHRPVAGRWLVRKTMPNARVRILSQQYFVRGVLSRPGPADSPRQHDRVRLEYGLSDANGNPVVELPAAEIRLRLMLVKPDGSVQSVAMRRIAGAGATRFAGVTETECSLSGRYWTTVDVSTVDANGNEVDLFHDGWSGFSVEPASRVDCRLEAADHWWTSRLSLAIQCFDRDQQPVEMTGLTRGAPGLLFRPSLQNGKRSIASALDLEYLGHGAFRGFVRGAERQGQYQLQLAVDRARVNPAYNVFLAPSSVSFVRGWPASTMTAALLVAGGVAGMIVATWMWRRRSG